MNSEQGETTVQARPIVYLFQHKTIPEALFEEHPELMSELKGEETVMPLLHFWSKAQFLAERNGFVSFDDIDNDDFSPFNEIKQSVFEQDEQRLHVYSMPSPAASPECYFVAIALYDEEKRYFTLEMPEKGDGGFFCEWTPDEQHINYGVLANKNIESFVNACFEATN